MVYPKDIIDNVKQQAKSRSTDKVGIIDPTVQADVIVGSIGAAMGLGIAYFYKYNIFAGVLLGAVAGATVSHILIKRK